MKRMNTVIKKNAVMILLLAFCFLSCTSNMNYGDEQFHFWDNYIIENKWKLVGNSIEDDPPHEIIYEFHKNNILTVKGDADKIDYARHDIGDHFLKFTTMETIRNHKPCPTCTYDPYGLIIDDIRYTYALSPLDPYNSEPNILVLHHYDNTNGSLYVYKLLMFRTP